VVEEEEEEEDVYTGNIDPKDGKSEVEDAKKGLHRREKGPENREW
jgi:hypothetical protein